MYLLNYEGQEAKGWLNDYLDRAEKQDCRNEDLAIITFKSDAKGASKTWISNMVPHAQIEQTVGKKSFRQEPRSHTTSYSPSIIRLPACGLT